MILMEIHLYHALVLFLQHYFCSHTEQNKPMASGAYSHFLAIQSRLSRVAPVTSYGEYFIAIELPKSQQIGMMDDDAHISVWHPYLTKYGT